MAYSARRLWTRVKIAGAFVLAGEVRVSESIEQLSRVAEFDLAEQPETEPDVGDTVLVEWFDFDAGRRYALFGGTVEAVEVESSPWQMTVRCTDQLRKLDRVRSGSDLALTGMSPKEALVAVLDYCGCAYDPDDLADPVYELGTEEPVKWLVDVPGSQIANELSAVFGCVLETVGADRIVWLSYDPTPDDATGLYGTYTKGTSIDFQGHHRTHGDRSRIQNNWIVRGPTYNVNKNCTATVWAKAVGTNPQLGIGRRGRIARQTFQSDLIQTEDLAEAVVRRLMRISNRLPDEASSPIVNDPNVHPGTKIAIVDPTYGIEADPRYFLVTGVDRAGSRMTLALSAGPGGGEGTVTTGVDKVCNDTSTDLDIPGGGFDFPDFDFPPIDLGDLDLGDLGDIPAGFGGDLDPTWGATGILDVRAIPPGGSFDAPLTVRLVPTFPAIVYYADDGSTPTTSSTMYTGDIAIAATTTLKFFGKQDDAHVSPVRTEVYTIVSAGCVDGIGTDADWFTDVGTAVTVEPGLLTCTAIASAFNQSVAIGWDDDWRLTAVVEGSVVGMSTPEIALGIVTNDLFGIGAAISMYDDGATFDVSTYLNNDNFSAQPFAVQEPMIWILARIGGRVYWSITQDTDTVAGSIDWGSPPETGDLAIRVLANVERMDVTLLEFCAGAGLGPVVPVGADWAIVPGYEASPWTFPSPGAVRNADADDADLYLTTFVLDGSQRFRFAGTLDFGSSDEVICSVVLNDSEGTPTGIFAGVQVIVGAGPAFYVQTFNGFEEDLGLDLGTGTHALEIDWNPGTNEMVVTIDAVVHTYALGTWPGPNTLHLDHGSAVAMDWDVTDITVRVGG